MRSDTNGRLRARVSQSQPEAKQKQRQTRGKGKKYFLLCLKDTRVLPCRRRKRIKVPPWRKSKKGKSSLALPNRPSPSSKLSPVCPNSNPLFIPLLPIPLYQNPPITPVHHDHSPANGALPKGVSAQHSRKPFLHLDTPGNFLSLDTLHTLFNTPLSSDMAHNHSYPSPNAAQMGEGPFFASQNQMPAPQDPLQGRPVHAFNHAHIASQQLAQSSLESTEGSARKRTKVSRACDECRRKKVSTW